MDRLPLCGTQDRTVDDLLANVAAARGFGWNAIHYARFDDLIPHLRAAGVRVE